MDTSFQVSSLQRTQSSISTPILLKLLFNKEDKDDPRRDNNAFLYRQEREEI